MNIKIYEQTLLLYELALSVGESLDPIASSKRFIDTLVRKKNLNFCALWVKGCLLSRESNPTEQDNCEEDQYQLVYATPKSHIELTTLPSDHVMIETMELSPRKTIQDSDPDFAELITEKQIDGGVFTIFKLEDVGFLKLYARDKSVFQERDLNQLRDVISKFAIALRGSLAHKQLQRETEKLKQTEEALITEQVKLKHQANYLISMNSDLEVEVLQRKRSQKELEDALHELKYQKRALDEHAIVCITDTNGQITYANKKFCDITGFDQDELLGHTYNLIQPGLHDHQYLQSLWSTLARGKTWQNVMKNKRKDGTIFWTDTTIVPYEDKNGNIYKYVYLSSNVSNSQNAGDENQVQK